MRKRERLVYEVIVETCIEINLVASYAGRTGSRQLRNRRRGFNSTQGHSDHPTLHSPTSLECSLSVICAGCSGGRGQGGATGRSRCEPVSCQLEWAGASHRQGSLLGCPHLGTVPGVTFLWIHTWIVEATFSISAQQSFLLALRQHKWGTNMSNYLCLSVNTFCFDGFNICKLYFGCKTKSMCHNTDGV